MKVVVRRYSFKQLMAGVTPENIHAERSRQGLAAA